MNKSYLPITMCTIVLAFIATSANAALMSQLDGHVVYDDILDNTGLFDEARRKANA